ncbi:PKD domain-containing protein [bacterium]|nr:PKD domain-containing protein [bacterium]
MRVSAKLRPIITIAALGLLCGCSGSAKSLTYSGASLPDTLSVQLAALDSLPPPEGVDGEIWGRLTAELARVLKERGSAGVSPAIGSAALRGGDSEDGGHGVPPHVRGRSAERAAETSHRPLPHGRFTSAPPGGAASASILSYDEASAALSWGYYSAGDYDQNGEVNISDLTPLGANFGKAAPGGEGEGGGFDPASIESVVDGDANGEINIADVTPIGVNFGVVVEGYRVYRSDDIADYPGGASVPNGPGSVLVAEIALSAATGGPDERRRFSFTAEQANPPAESLAGGFYWVRPYDGAEEGVPSSAVEVGQNGEPLNIAPLAVLFAEPVSGLAPLTVQFNAYASIDTDGTIVKYEWDFDGPLNGEEWENTGSLGLAAHTYSETGGYFATLRVTDDEGATDIDVAPVNVREAIAPTARLARSPSSGVVPLHVVYDASASFDDDGLIVRYEWDFDNDGEFEFDSGGDPITPFSYWTPKLYTVSVRVMDEDGLSDTASITTEAAQGAKWEVMTVVEDLSPGVSGNPNVTALLEVDGLPAICFAIKEIELEPGYMAYIRALDADGNDWGESIDLEMGDIDGRGVGFEIVEGRPAVLSDNLYKRANDAQGVSWPPAAAIPEVGNGFQELVLLGGVPATCNARFFAKATDPLGESWGEPSPVYGPNSSNHLSMAVVGGKPAMAVYRSSIGVDYDDLLYISARDKDGEQWNVPVVLEYLGIGAGTPRLAEAAGLPAIAYVNHSLGALKYIRAINESGGKWGEPLVLDSQAKPGVSLALLDGRPAVVYLKTEDLQLMFIAANDAEGASWGFPVLVDGSRVDSYAENLSLAVVDGSPAVSYTLIRQDLPGKEHELRYAAYR